MEEKTLAQLNETADNPRILMQPESEKLDRSLDEFGSMDGIVNNVNPAIDQLVSGNQRTNKFKADSAARIVILERYEEPTSTGTVAVGYVMTGGERWPYREVFWDEAKHDKGVVLGNQHAGSNDNDKLAERYHNILEHDPEALESLFITPEEVSTLQDGWVDHDNPNDDDDDDDDEEEEEAKTPSAPKKATYTIKQLIDLRNSFIEAMGLGDNGFVAWLKDREGDQ